MSAFSFSIRAEATIRAPPDTVFGVLVAFDRYAEWATQLVHHGGTPALGGTIDLEMRAGRTHFRFRPTIVALESGRRFTWRQRTGLPGVFDGEHAFVLEPLPGGATRLINTETYSGVLAPLVRRLPMMRDAPAGFAQFNHELRARAEQLARPAADG